jgi:hypothetical protein
LATIRAAFVFFFILGVAIACLVVGSTTGRYVGAVLLLAWLLVAYRISRRYLVGRARATHSVNLSRPPPRATTRRSARGGRPRGGRDRTSARTP